LKAKSKLNVLSPIKKETSPVRKINFEEILPQKDEELRVETPPLKDYPKPRKITPFETSPKQ
jgi:hypothetical protein